MQGGEEEPAASSHDTPSRAGQPFITIIKKKQPKSAWRHPPNPFRRHTPPPELDKPDLQRHFKALTHGRPERGAGRCRGTCPGAAAAQMMPVGAKTGATQSDSAISQPQDSGAQTLSRSSSLCGGLPWKSWMVFLQRGRHGGAAPCETLQDGSGEGGAQGLSRPPEQQPPVTNCLDVLKKVSFASEGSFTFEGRFLP